MKFLKFSVSSILLQLAFLILAGCTIIRDTDLTNPGQFSKLTLKSIDIFQDTYQGSQTANAPVSFYSQGRISSISIPQLIMNKLRFRCQLSGPVILDFTYASSSKNWNVGLRGIQNNDYSEFYQFGYDNSGRLDQFVTSIYAVGDTLQTIDSLIYDSSGNLSAISRRSSDVSRNGTITLSINPSDGAVAISYLGTQYSQGQSYCTWEAPNTCGSYSSNSAANFAYGYYFDVTSDNRLSQLDIQDIGGQQSLYYFHPFMVLGDQFVLGKNLLLIYMIDWWTNGRAPTTSNSKNDVVTFGFNYGR
jgi:hypothetical protein